MAYEVLLEVPNVHEDAVCSIAFDRAKRAVYTAAEGDKAIKVWDLKTGVLLRVQTGHRGVVTAVAYAPWARLLFSASVDGAVGVWADKGALLQMVPTSWPLFSLAWSERHRILVAGGHSVLHIYQVDAAEATRLRHAHLAAAAGSGKQQAGGGGGAAGGGGGVSAAVAAALAGEGPPVLRRVCPPFRGWPHPSARAAAAARRASGDGGVGGGARSTADTVAAAADVATRAGTPLSLAGGGLAAKSRPASAAGSKAAAAPGGGSSAAAAAAALGPRGAREEDYFSACNTDVIKCIVVTDGGKIFTSGFDRSICIYEIEKLDKGRDCFRRVRDCARAGVVSLCLDPRAGVLLAGSLEGALRVWSAEGRCLDKVEGLAPAGVAAAAAGLAGVWWASGRLERVNVIDPRAPANITAHVAQQNHLLSHQVELLYAPPGTDLMLAATHKRSLVAWQFNPAGAHRVFKAHDDWVEGLFAVKTGPDPFDERLYTFSASGSARAWELDAEQGCDIYKLLDEVRLAGCSVRSLLHHGERGCLVAGCADGVIRLSYADGEGPGDAALPTTLNGHDGVVAGLALLSDKLLLSAGADATLRVWDLDTMKQLAVESVGANRAPITCLEWCAPRQQAALCVQGSRAYVYSFQHPSMPRLAAVLDHGEPRPPAQQQGAQEEGRSGSGAGGGKGKGRQQLADVLPDKPSNMVWLTRSDLEGLPADTGKACPGGGGGGGLPALVAEAIRDASVDIPEVVQIRWAAFREAWVTVADDATLRLWSPAGAKLGSMPLKGGRPTCLFVDEGRELVMVAAADKSVYVYRLDEPTPVTKYSGHEDVVSAICHVGALDLYMTGSWDGTMRLWPRPAASTPGLSASPSTAPSDRTRAGAAAEDSEDEPSLVPTAPPAPAAGGGGAGPGKLGKPRGRRGAGGVAGGGGGGGAAAELLLLAGRRASEAGSIAGARRLSDAESDVGTIAGSCAAASGGGRARGGDRKGADAPGSLGARLNDLGRQLLGDLEGQFAAAQEAASHRLGAEYVAAAVAAAAAEGGRRGSHPGFACVGFASSSGGGGGGGGGRSMGGGSAGGGRLASGPGLVRSASGASTWGGARQGGMQRQASRKLQPLGSKSQKHGGA